LAANPREVSARRPAVAIAEEVRNARRSVVMGVTPERGEQT
jgi:hypothetical protein